MALEESSVISIGEVAKQAGMTPSSIRFYESVGLIQAARSHGGQRRYSAEVLGALRYISFAKSAGFTLSEIGRLMLPPEPGEPLFGHWCALAERKLEELDDVIRRAQEMQSRLRAALDCRCGTEDECALIEPASSC